MDEDMINNLSSMLKNSNIPDNIKNIMTNFTSNSSNEQNPPNTTNIDPNMLSTLLSSFNQNSSDTSNSNTGSNIDMETILKMKSIIDKMNKNQNDPRSTLLRSLKPYLRSSRKEKLDQYVKLLSMTSVMEVLGNNRW